MASTNVETPTGEPVVKTAKQLEKEAKKLAKLEKFKQKHDNKTKETVPKENKPEVCYC